MCGGTQAQTDLQTQQAAFYQQAQTEAQQTYGEDQALLSQMTSVYEPILAKGPNQQGFSAPELENLNAQAVGGTAANYAGAAKAVNESLAAEGGGTNPLTSGGQAEMKQDVANTAAGTESAEESQIQQADYQQGYNEYTNAGSALAAVSGQLNPAAYESQATSAGSAAATTAEDIAKEQNSVWSGALGGLGGIAGDIPWGDIGGGLSDFGGDVGGGLDDFGGDLADEG